MALKRTTVQFASLPIIRRTGALTESTQLRWDVEPQHAAASASRRRSADDINIAFSHCQMNSQGPVLRKPLPSEIIRRSHSKRLSNSFASKAQPPSILRRKTVSTMTKIYRKPLKTDDKRRFPLDATVATGYRVDSNCGKEAGETQANAKPQERGELLTSPCQNAAFYSGLSGTIANKTAIDDGQTSPGCAEDAEAPPRTGAHLLDRVWRGLEQSPVDLAATSPRLSVPPPLRRISVPSISSLGTLEAYSGLQPSSRLGLARPSQSASARAEISLNLIGPGNLNSSDMLSPANQTPVPPVPSVAGTATTPSPGLSRWYAGKSRDEAEISTHSRGVSDSSANPAFPYESGSVAGSSSPRTSSNAHVSQDDLFDADLAARGSPQRKLASPKSKPAMEKFRLFRRNRGPSFSDESSPKPDRSRRGAFDRLGAWFSRSQQQQQQQNTTPVHGRAPESSVAQTMEWLRPVSSHPAPGHTRFYSDDRTGRGRRRSNVESQTSFEGQHPPPEGYFAPESFSRFRHSPRASQSSQQLASASAASLSHQPDSWLALPDRLPSPAGSFSYSGRTSPQSPPPAPPLPHLHLHHQQQMTLPPSPHHPQLSPQLSPQFPSPPHLASPLPPVIPRTPPSRGRSVDRAYTQDLHIRSRSPKTFPPRPEERSYPSTDTSDPANNLGTFRSNPRTSRIGDQELPWKLTLPSDSDEERAADAGTTATAREREGSWLESTTQQLLQSSRLPTYEEDSEVHGQPPRFVVADEKAAGDEPGDQRRGQGQGQGQVQSQRHPHRGEARAINPDDAPVELPVQRDDDSGEEITMSSTAYPGQEWRPLGFSGWEY